MLTNIYQNAAAGRVLLGMHRRRMAGVAGVGDINSDAMAMFNRAGITADCKFVPYIGPFGGGHNVCDVTGDTRGAEFGAELIAKSGGIDIYKTETANAAAYMAARAAEQKIIVENQRRLNAVRTNVVPVQTVPVTGGQHVTNAAATMAALTANAQPVSTSTGPAATTGTVVSTATGPVGLPWGAMGLGIDIGSLPWGWIAAGVGALFLIPKLTGGGR